MRGFFESLIIFWKPDVEFISPLSINTCRNRLEDLGAGAYEKRWYWRPSDVKRISFYLKRRNYSRSIWEPAISGILRETEEGTKVSAKFEPTRLYWNIGILFILLLIILFSQYNSLLVFLDVFVIFVNVAYIFSFRSSWESLENKLVQNLKSWKRDF